MLSPLSRETLTLAAFWPNPSPSSPPHSRHSSASPTNLSGAIDSSHRPLPLHQWSRAEEPRAARAVLVFTPAGGACRAIAAAFVALRLQLDAAMALVRAVVLL